MTYTQDEQRALLEEISSLNSQGHAEMEDKESFLRSFYPVPAHYSRF